LKNDKQNWRDWFILTRTNKEAYQLADLLDDEGIDYCFITRSEMTLDELQDAMKKNLVKIMTVHASKGLENKKVILYGRFPIQQPPYMRNPEERKVMYVGVTRAIESLYIFN
jgi:superfamily I DNA/RNA helicase